MTTTLRPMPDPEVEALNTIIASLENLSDDQRRHVMLYVTGRYGGRASAYRPPSGATPGNSSGEETLAGGAQYSTLGDLFDAANAQSETDRVLVVAYWKQVVEGAESFEAFPVSKELRHLGHGVANITRALDLLIKQTPKLVLQVAKSGKSQQARKRYKVTREGIRRVQAMINADQGEGNVG